MATDKSPVDDSQDATFSLFPKSHSSDASLGSSAGTNTPTFECPSLILHEKLSRAACFALVDLIATVLRLDFWHQEDPFDEK
ncbi:unnamed protein product [Gongylonema pulchrum]|uniref:Uncharacterized protein n=1 Tax=Gongylonema pulchrum TaxID=637853 RepID=A0A183E4C1_9BILA|nr:unnamed protein product [Gongylonema pulchrum]